MKTPKEFLATVFADMHPDRRVFPLSFTLTETSNAQRQKAYLDPSWASIVLGMDDVSMRLETLLVPLDVNVPAGCDGFDHLPCLKALWPLYTWEVAEVKWSGPTIAPPRPGQKEAVIIDTDETLDIQLVGVMPC